MSRQTKMILVIEKVYIFKMYNSLLTVFIVGKLFYNKKDIFFDFIKDYIIYCYIKISSL